MQTRWLKGFAIVAATAAVLVASACVGDDAAVTTGESKPDGERGGKCFPNKTCTGAELSCVDGLCILPGDGSGDGGTDGGGGTDAEAVDASDDGGDAGPEAGCPAPPSPNPNEIECNGTSAFCATGTGCCTLTGTCGPCNGGGTTLYHDCRNVFDCPAVSPNTGACCLTRASGAPGTTPGQCPAKITDFSSTTCVQTINNCAGGLITCNEKDTCPNGSTCSAVDVEIGSVANGNLKTLKLGVCVPNATP